MRRLRPRHGLSGVRVPKRVPRLLRLESRVAPVLALVSAFAAGCATLPRPLPSATVYSGEGRNEVFVVDHGYHTGLVVPAAVLAEEVPELGEGFPGARYLEIGWGDEGFYQAERITVRLAVRALFWPTPAVVHVVEVPESPDNYFPESVTALLCADEDHLGRLADFVGRSFAKDPGGGVMAKQNGLYGNSQFYAGVGRYFVFNTCNQWTAKALESLGMNTEPESKLTAGSVMGFLENNSGSRFLSADDSGPGPFCP